MTLPLFILYIADAQSHLYFPMFTDDGAEIITYLIWSAISLPNYIYWIKRRQLFLIEKSTP